MSLGQWRQEIVEVSKQYGIGTPVSLGTARDLSNRLCEYGYVNTTPVGGKRQQVALTDKGIYSSYPVGGRWARFVRLREPSSSSPTTVEAPVESFSAPKRARTSRSPNRSVAQERRLRVMRMRRHEQINGYHRIALRGNKTRYLQLLSNPDEWAGGKVWENVYLGFDKDGLDVLAWIASEGEHDEVAAAAPSSWAPHDCVFALAVELEKNRDGLVAATYVDLNGEIRPKIGFLEQSFGNFFRPLMRLDSPMSVIEVKGRHKGLRRRFELNSVADPLAEIPEPGFDLDDLCASMQIEQHRELLGLLPRGWFAMPAQRRKLVWSLLNRAPIVAVEK